MIASPRIASTRSFSSTSLSAHLRTMGVAAALCAALLPSSGARAETPTPTPHCASLMGYNAGMQLPPCAVPTVSATTTPILCSQLDTLLPGDFHSNMRLQINPGSHAGCSMHRLAIAQTGSPLSNIIIEGNGDTPVIINPAVTDGSQNGFEIYNVTNIVLRNLRFAAQFKQPIVVASGSHNVTLENIIINNPLDAGITIAGENVCLRRTFVSGANVGYRVASSAQGSIDFRGATAMSNTGDGFAIDHSGGPSHAQFLSCSSVTNGGDGYDVFGPKIEVLCSEARANGSRGIEAIGTTSPSTLQVENCEIKDNSSEGIHVGEAGQQVKGNILSNTLDNNGGAAIVNGAVLNVYDTISTGDVFVSTSGTVNCGNNLYKIKNACPATPVGVGTPGSTKATPHFVDSSRTKLAPDSAGVNQGIFPATPAAALGIPVLVAQTRDAVGVSRSSKSGYDIGAYFAPAANTSTPTGRPTSTRTNTRTVTPTATRTPQTPVSTGTPCTTPRVACTGDCDGDDTVSINELIKGINIASGGAPLSSCPAFDINCSGTVSVAELVQAVDLSLLGCPMMPGVVTADAQTATTKIVVGSALGNPGDTVSFSVDILNGAFQPGGTNLDLMFPVSQLTWPDCTIDPGLAAQGLKLVTSALGPVYGYGVERLVLSQADQNAGDMGGMLCPGPTMADGAFATCTAQIATGATAGFFNWLDNGASALSDVYGGGFNTVFQPGLIVVNGTDLPGAQFVSQSVPSTMTAGQQYTVSVTMKNPVDTNGKVWTASPLEPQYGLGDPDAGYSDTDIWGVNLNRVELQSGEAVAPGSQKTFTFTVTAPSPTYNNEPFSFRWQMVHDSAGTTSWFGETSPDVEVTVACGACGCS